MIPPSLIAFLPEYLLLLGGLLVFVISLGEARDRLARWVTMATALATVVACIACLGQEATLFHGAYRVDPFSQLLKLILALGFVLVMLASRELPDIRFEVKSEYFLFLILHVFGLVTLVSSIDLITLVVALELSAFPLYLMVAMRREREGQRIQMESAIKYIMFGVAANGIMFFGMSYLFGLSGTTSLPQMFARLQLVAHSPLAIAGLAMTFCGFYYKLAVFPFHFWAPDVYQGASNETAGLVASLPKVAAIAVLVRFASLTTPDNPVLVTLMAVLAAGSMFYGNFVALAQKDLKRLLGFSGIAHAGYALIGFVTLDQAGYTAALFYMAGYLLMVLACFIVVSKVSRDGANVSMEELAGLHRRSPLLAITLITGIFALAGIPPFAGFMGKLILLTAALAKGHLALVIIAVVNTAIAIYYYLCVVREACCRDPGHQPAIALDWPTRAFCLMLIAGIVILGVAPNLLLSAISSSLGFVNLPIGD